MKPETKERLKKAGKLGICILALVGGLASTYFLVPKRTEIIDLGAEGMEETPIQETYFERFVTRLTSAADVDSEETFDTLKADFNNFEIAWDTNVIKIDGNLMFSMVNLNDLSLSLDVDVDYNSKVTDVALAFVNKTAYLAIKDLRLKQSFVEYTDPSIFDFGDLYDRVYSEFFDPDNEEGLRINFDITKMLGSLIGGIDLSSLMSGGTDLKINETVHDDGVTINLDIGLPADEGEEATNINIVIELGKEKLDLRKVDLGTIKIGGVTIKGQLDCVSSPDLKILGLDDPDYPRKRGEFTEIINYSRWIDKIFELLKTRQIGLDVYADVKAHEGGTVTNLGYINLNADLDASGFFDISDFDLLGAISGTADIKTVLVEDGLEDVDNEITGLLNKFDFNVGLKLGNVVDGEKVDYSNLSLAYYTNEEGHNAGFLTFNEKNDNAVMKAKIDVQTINCLISKIGNLIDSLNSEKVKSVKRDSNGVEDEQEVGFFDFVTSSPLMTAIYEGHYEGILDVLETLKSTEKTIEIGLNLSSLGFGNNSKISLILDANEDSDAPTKIISIKAENVFLNELEINAEINTRAYSSSALKKVDANRDSYDNLNFLPGMFDQIQGIIDTKQVGFVLDGDIKDVNGIGFDFDGWAQLDYGASNGFGSIKFNEYKTNKDVISNDHKIDISIDDFSNDHAKNNMLFQYGNPKLAGNDSTPLRGKFTLKTFDDIIDLVKELIQARERRFMKFLDDIINEFKASLIYTVIESKDYLQLTQSSLIKKVAQSADGKYLDIVISGKLIPLDLVDSDIQLQLEFKGEGESRKLKAINIVDLQIGEKKVNVNIALEAYNPTKVNPVDTTASFMNFSDISTLLTFGINTMELNYYHLTGKISLNAIAIINFNLDVDFHIYVKDETTKVYGKINDIPVIGDILHLCDVDTEFVFEPDHDASDNDIGGYFYILRSENLIGSVSDKQYYYKSDSKNFVDNILNYLLADVLGIDIVSYFNLDDLDIGGNAGEVNPIYQDMFDENGFVYTQNGSKHTWDVAVDLGVATGNSSFSLLNAKLDGVEVDGKGYFSHLEASTRIITILNVGAKLDLVNPDPSVHNWPNDIESRYSKIVGYYSTLTAKQQESMFNIVDKYYKCNLGTI